VEAERAAAKAAADEAAAKAQAEAERVKEAEAERVKAATAQAAAVVQQAKAVADAKVAAAAQTVATAAAKVAPSEGNVAQWAKWLADQLRRVPNIEVYDALRLADLESRGPLPARGVWQTAKDALLKEYGNVTIGELLQRFQG
jgi:hypothetical protein